MEIIGELERLFATSLYPNRVLVAVGLVVGLGLLSVVAWRRGWLAAARRHPARTAALLIVLLAVGGPAAWYLGSPLFIRTVLVEPAPSPGLGAPATPGLQTDRPEPQSEPPLAAPRQGQFRGADDFHFGSGTALLLEVSPGSWVVRFEDFSVRNGPDLYVYLSPDPEGYVDGAIELATLEATDGSFNVEIPAGADLSGVRSVVIWCKAFAVQFAHATLE